MKILILSGSPRSEGNTEALIAPFSRELEKQSAESRVIRLRDKEIASCNGCKACQDNFDSYACCLKDDMYEVVEGFLWCDCFILATPIYSWYCTVPMKAVLDRHYGLNKYYGAKRGPSLWAGKKCGLLITCGYEIEYGVGPFEEGIKRLCRHSKLEYIGKLGVQDKGDPAVFHSPETADKVRAFAREVACALQNAD